MSAAPHREELRFIVWLRAVAVLLVLWHHLVTTFCRAHKIDFAPNSFVNQFVSGPLKLDLGQLGVGLFFVVSGFVITYVAMVETRTEFAFKRIFRIYPPVIVAVLLTALARAIFGEAPSAYEVFKSFWIVNGIYDGNFSIVALMWTLVLEVMFYAIVFAAMPLLKRWPVWAVIGQLAAVALVTALYPPPQWYLQRPAVLFTALTSLFVGQTIYLIWSGRMRVPLGLALLLAWWVVGEWAMQTHSTKFIETNAVAVWRLLTYLGFAVLLAFEDRLIVPRWVAFIAATSYSVYLLQEPFGWTPLEFTTLAIGYPLALVLAIVMTLVASSLCYIVVERPSQKMARVLVKTATPQRAAPGTAAL